MCSHFGVAGGGIINWDLEIVKDLGIMAQLRGRDGAGIFQIKSTNYGGKTTFQYEAGYKTMYSFCGLLDEIDMDKKAHGQILNSVSVDIIMGHTRASTRGIISDANAHPFYTQNLVGAHNGTLKDQKYLGDPKKTDSEMLFKDISTRGMKVVLEELDKDSAFACVMYNRVDSMLYFVRNELRTLSYAFLLDRDVMYWASEANMLRYILDRAGERYKIVHLNPNHIMKIKVSDIRKETTDKEVLRTLKHHCALTRPVPTTVQKAMDAEKKKNEILAKAKEEKEEKEKQGQLLLPDPNKVNNVLAFPKTEGDKEPPKVVEGLVSKKQKGVRFSAKTLYSKCSCGSVSMSLLDQNMSLRGKNPEVRFHPVDKKHYCKKCEPIHDQAIG
jgi:hypothetical protein